MTDIESSDTDTENDEPAFRIIQRGPLRLIDETTGVRPCAHRSFICDDEWNTVTCGVCHCQVDPYAALRQFAQWYVNIESDLRHLEHSKWEWLGMQVREMLKRKQFTDDERATIGRQTRLYGQGHGLKEMRKLHAEIQRRVDDDRDERVQKRNAAERQRQDIVGSVKRETIVHGGIIR